MNEMVMTRRAGGRAARVAARSAPLAENLRPVRPGLPGGQYKPLTEAGVKRIHQAALEALEKIGQLYAEEATIGERGLDDADKLEYRAVHCKPLVDDFFVWLRETVQRTGVAAHHAGHLPSWKIAVEELMRRGCLDAVFATTTLAAGVDFPARTVVITQSSVRKARDFTDLTVSEIQQLSGRAGRRPPAAVADALTMSQPGVYTARP